MISEEMEERKNKDIIINILHTTQMTNCLNNNSEIYWEHIHLLLVEMLQVQLQIWQ